MHVPGSLREIETIGGQKVTTGCIGCSLVSGNLVHPASIYRSDHFDVHQDVEIALPGFLIVSTVRHIASVREFSREEGAEFSQIVPRMRRAQYGCGFDNVYLFQNEDTADHFHLWMFPIYAWMRQFGKGAALLAASMQELKQGRHASPAEEVLNTAARIRASVNADDDGPRGAFSNQA